MKSDKREEISGRERIPPVGGRTRGFTAFAFAAMVLAGCSSVPDALNPVEWYKGTRDFIAGDDSDKQANQENTAPAQGLAAERGTPPPGANEPIPSLGTVPERPQTSSSEERRQITEGLISDRNEQRRYSGEEITRQAPAEAQLAPPPPAQVAPPPAPAAPNQPVAIQPGQQQVPAAPPPQPQSREASPSPSPPIRQVAGTPQIPAAPPRAPALQRPAPQTVQRQAPIAAAVPRTGTVPPRAPALAPVPPAVFGSDDGIVVVSGNGTQTVRAIETASLSGAAAGVPEVRQPGASLGTRPLEEFNPASARGSYQVADILFPNGSAALGGVEREILREVVKQHRQVGGTIRVVGHASRRTKTLEPIQHKLVNFQVSAARAEAVARELIRLGVAPDELYIGAVADQDPRYREYMPSGEAGNRRAEIFIDY